VTLVNFEKALPGRTLVLRGESGAGKTTILNCIAGLARPERGEIRLEGGLLFSSSRRIDLPPRERRIGYAFQHYALFPHLCALDNVALAMPRGERPEARVLLARFGLEPHAHKRPASLSGGERQRLALARALSVRPRLLLLDEPFAALDRRTRESTQREFLALREDFECAAILVSHDRAEAELLGHSIIEIVDGEAVE
jgi:molybdate transport system ATP-binding protein